MKYPDDYINKIIQGDSLEVLKTLPDELVDCCVTSPPYWGLRDYGIDGQLGLEKIPEEYISKMVEIFKEVKRVLKKRGNCWLNLGDTYSGSGNGSWNVQNPEHYGKQYYKGKRPNEYLAKPRTEFKSLKPKNLVGIPWRVAFALQSDGWWLRQDIIWHKPNPMPESVTDRCTKSHEYVFLLTKSTKYYFDSEAIKECAVDDESCKGKRKRTGGQRENEFADKYLKQNFRNIEKGKKYELINKRSVWTVSTYSFRGAHFATFPPKLIEPMILAGCPKDGIVLDPFSGAGTTCIVAKKLERKYLGIELNPKYIEMTNRRIEEECGRLFG